MKKQTKSQFKPNTFPDDMDDFMPESPNPFDL